MGFFKQIFTVFDVLEQKGYFALNPANPGARTAQGQMLYKGPVKFPRMVYHPQGLEVVTVPAQPQMTPMGPQMVGEQRELVYKIVEDENEYKEAREAGWFDTPAESVAARPPKPAAPAPTPAPAAGLAGFTELMAKFDEMAGRMDALATTNAALEKKNAELEAKLADL